MFDSAELKRYHDLSTQTKDISDPVIFISVPFLSHFGPAVEPSQPHIKESKAPLASTVIFVLTYMYFLFNIMISAMLHFLSGAKQRSMLSVTGGDLSLHGGSEETFEHACDPATTAVFRKKPAISSVIARRSFVKVSRNLEILVISKLSQQIDFRQTASCIIHREAKETQHLHLSKYLLNS